MALAPCFAVRKPAMPDPWSRFDDWVLLVPDRAIATRIPNEADRELPIDLPFRAAAVPVILDPDRVAAGDRIYAQFVAMSADRRQVSLSQIVGLRQNKVEVIWPVAARGTVY